MFSTADTIVAIATPPGRGGIGVVRLSGPSAQDIARHITTHSAAFTPRHATLTCIADETADVECGLSRSDGRVRAIEQVIVTCFPAPASYTGDDVVELSAHGSPVVLRAIVAAAVAAGARAAAPGEFTLRAYLNGRIDLTQAEAVADLIEAATPLQARAAFDQLQGTLTRRIAVIDATLFDLIARLEASVDFPDEGYHFVEPGEVARAIDRVRACTGALLAESRRGRMLREGLQIAIVGKPNVGKSSLFNALAGAPRAIVTEVPGTTRDLITETVDFDGLRVTLVDTAGIHETDDRVELQGIARSREAQRVADLILVVLDGSEPLNRSDDQILACSPKTNRVLVANKADLSPAWSRPDALRVSAATGEGLDELQQCVIRALDLDLLAERPGITNVRHIALVQTAHDALGRAREAAGSGDRSLPEEFVLADLQDARAALEEVTGRRTPDDVLAHIFASFCVGK